MIESLQNTIDRYNNGLLDTRNLQISNKQFLTESISDKRLTSSVFKNSSLINLNFTTVNFASSFFEECLFENCIFDLTSFKATEFENCSLRNCQMRNCNLAQVSFTETIFDTCCFEKVEQGCLAKGWFESCDFRNTHFEGFEGISLIETAVVDSKFSKFNKSIEFKGEFFLIDILHSKNGIDEMFIE